MISVPVCWPASCHGTSYLDPSSVSWSPGPIFRIEELARCVHVHPLCLGQTDAPGEILRTFWRLFAGTSPVTPFHRHRFDPTIRFCVLPHAGRALHRRKHQLLPGKRGFLWLQAASATGTTSGFGQRYCPFLSFCMVL